MKKVKFGFDQNFELYELLSLIDFWLKLFWSWQNVANVPAMLLAMFWFYFKLEKTIFKRKCWFLFCIDEKIIKWWKDISFIEKFQTSVMFLVLCLSYNFVGKFKSLGTKIVIWCLKLKV